MVTDTIEQTILIKADSKRNGFTTFLAGIGVLGLAMMLLALLPESLFLVGIFVLSGALVTMLIG